MKWVWVWVLFVRVWVLFVRVSNPYPHNLYGYQEPVPVQIVRVRVCAVQVRATTRRETGREKCLDHAEGASCARQQAVARRCNQRWRRVREHAREVIMLCDCSAAFSSKCKDKRGGLLRGKTL